MSNSGFPQQRLDFDPFQTPQTSVYDDKSATGSSGSATRKLISIRIKPPVNGGDGLSSSQLAQMLLEQINDPQSKLHASIGRHGALGAGVLAPPDSDLTGQSCSTHNCWLIQLRRFRPILVSRSPHAHGALKRSPVSLVRALLYPCCPPFQRSMSHPYKTPPRPAGRPLAPK